MNSNTIYICSNRETLCDGQGFPSEAEKDAADDMIRHGIEVAEMIGFRVQLAPQFRDWHGGRFDQFYYRVGFVAVSTNATELQKKNASVVAQKMSELAEEIAESLQYVADEYRAELNNMQSGE